MFVNLVVVVILPVHYWINPWVYMVQIFTSRIHFLILNQQCQTTKGNFMFLCVIG